MIYETFLNVVAALSATTFIVDSFSEPALAVAPLIAAAALASAAHLVGGVLTNDSASEANDKSIEAQRSENALDRLFNANEAKKNRDFQAQQSDLAYQRSLPSTQLANLKAAGINPYLANFQPANAQAMSGSTATSSSNALPQVQGTDYSFLGDSVSSAISTYFQNEMNESAINKNNREAELTHQQGISQEIANRTQAVRDNLGLLQTMAQIDDTIAHTNLTDQQRQNLIEQKKILEDTVKYNQDTYIDRIQQPGKQNAVSDSVVALNTIKVAAEKAHIRLSNQQCALYAKQIEEIAANIKLTEAKTDSEKETKDLIHNEAEKVVQETLRLEKDNKNYPLFVRLTESQIFKNYQTQFHIGPISFGQSYDPAFDDFFNKRKEDELNGTVRW